MVAIIVLAVAVYVQRMTQGDPTARRRCWHKEGSRGDFDEEEDVVEEEKKMKMVVVVMMVRRRRRRRKRKIRAVPALRGMSASVENSQSGGRGSGVTAKLNA